MDIVPKSKIQNGQYCRFQQAHLLLTRLNDNDIDCPQARKYLNFESIYVLENCVNFFQAYCYIMMKAKVLAEMGYELSEHWEMALSSAYEHLDSYCFSCLSGSDAEQYIIHSKTCLSAALTFHRRSLIPGGVYEKQCHKNSSSSSFRPSASS